MGNKIIFIIGQHRTGSTLLKNILNANSNVTMAFDEMNLFEPFRSNTLDKILAKNDITAGQLIDYISGKQVYGTFWQDFEKSGISFSELESKLNDSDNLTSQYVIREVLHLLTKKNGTSVSGVKYPIHFRKIEYLFNHFSDSKIIFITRNPPAIIASKLNDKATRERKNKSFGHRAIIHYFTVFYFLLEYIYSVKIFLKFREHFKLVTYENLVVNQQETVSDLCEWCGIKFEKQMIKVSGKSTSHGFKNNSGLHTQSIDKYKEVLTPFDKGLISLLTHRYYKKIKDELNTNL